MRSIFLISGFGLFSFQGICAAPTRAFAGSPSPQSPRKRLLGVGGGGLEGAKMALGLACRQGWWRSCSAGAIFPRGAGGALCGVPTRPGAAMLGLREPRAAGPRRPGAAPRPQLKGPALSVGAGSRGGGLLLAIWF